MDTLEAGVRWLGGIAGVVILAFLIISLLRGAERMQNGPRKLSIVYLYSRAFYVLSILIFAVFCIWAWKPLPIPAGEPGRQAALVIGGLFYFGGLGWLLWGRVALGRNYFVSSIRGAPLYTDHQLVTRGPYAVVRHPMYLGLILAGLGGLLLYRNWTFALLAVDFPFVMLRAPREEQALSAAFGADWAAYKARTPALLPRLPLNHLPTGLAALTETALLFLPALPAYLWLWPYVNGTLAEILQTITYLYILTGTLLIGRKYGLWNDPGLWRGDGWLCLLCGAALIGGRTLVILAVDWGAPAPAFNGLRAAWDFVFYLALVGLGEELLFRGLIYNALRSWRGSLWAVWGSSLAFALWHVLGQGLLVAAVMLFYGLIFALLRLRGAALPGLVAIHGLIDFSAAQLLPTLTVTSLGRPDIPHPVELLIGLGLIAAVPFYLWLLHPRWIKFRDTFTSHNIRQQ